MDFYKGGIAIDDSMLVRLLVKSHQLKLLDLRGCSHITAVGIQVSKVMIHITCSVIKWLMKCIRIGDKHSVDVLYICCQWTGGVW